MNEQDIQNIIKGLEPYLNQKMKENTSHAKTALFKEDSNLVGEMKNSHGEIKTELQGVNKRLDTVNGNLTKHNDKLAQHDIINAQTVLALQGLTQSIGEMKSTDLKTLKEANEANSKYITGQKATIDAFKWIAGFIGFGTLINLAMLVKYLVK